MTPAPRPLPPQAAPPRPATPPVKAAPPPKQEPKKPPPMEPDDRLYLQALRDGRSIRIFFSSGKSCHGRLVRFGRYTLEVETADLGTIIAYKAGIALTMLMPENSGGKAG